jgi:flagellar basal-body rod modification protein FlgD
MYMSPLTSSEIQAFNAKGGSAAANTDPAAAQERFLKLFVAQLNNQDPLNPMDNAQMTSQMAQINTVTGIQQLNETLKGMSTQLSAFQGMQGASLVGRQVLVNGQKLGFEGDVGQGAFSLPEAANAVAVDVMGTAGQVLGSINLGARSAGMHSFDWDATGIDRSLIAGFKVTATAGGKTIAATTLSPQRVESVGMVDGSMRLRTESGQTVAYSDVLAFM